jgi:Holliday junction resolvase RusA-like endonuclease
MAWDAFEILDADRLLRVAIPFDYAASKNAVWRTGRGGHVYARKESVAFRHELTAMIGDSAEGRVWYQRKTYIDVFVEKPNHRGDATNVLDLVCDAIKDAIGVDDRWYAITRLDWSIVKVDPRIIVGIRQCGFGDQQVCSHCGRALARTLEFFGKNASTSTGLSRVCKECGAPKRGPRKVVLNAV